MSSCTFDVHLKPRAGKDRIALTEAGVLEISVTSPPLENRANEHLVKLLAKKLGVPKKSISIIKGEHSRNKAVAVDGLTSEEAAMRLLKGEKT